MIISKRVFIITFLFLLMNASKVLCDVEQTNLERLTKDSELIIIGKITKVYPDKAEVEVIKTLKGETYLGKLYYRINGGFICDVSRAVENETNILFFENSEIKGDLWVYSLTSFGAGRLVIERVDAQDYVIDVKGGTFFPKKLKHYSHRDLFFPSRKLIKIKLIDIISFIKIASISSNPF